MKLLNEEPDTDAVLIVTFPPTSINSHGNKVGIPSFKPFTLFSQAHKVTANFMEIILGKVSRPEEIGVG
jgi:hypothetical protein